MSTVIITLEIRGNAARAFAAVDAELDAGTLQDALAARGVTVVSALSGAVARDKGPCKPELTNEQRAVLVAFATRHGRTWKAKLNVMWANGRDDKHPNGSILRQIRNTFGPSWLAKFKLPEVK